jgi:hypothetical protein
MYAAKIKVILSSLVAGSLIVISCGNDDKPNKPKEETLTEVKSFTKECVKSPSKHDAAIDKLLKTVGIEYRDEKSCKLAAHKLFQKENLLYTGKKQSVNPFELLSGFTNVKNLEITVDKDKKHYDASLSSHEDILSGLEKLGKLETLKITNQDHLGKEFIKSLKDTLKLLPNFKELL